MTLSDLHTLAKLRPSRFGALALVSTFLLAGTIVWAQVDARTIDAVAVWSKPLKFALSFAVFFATIALVETRLSARARLGWTMHVSSWVMAAAFLAEMGYIIFQAAQGEPSHFNRSTPFHAFMYAVVMAAGAVALVASTAVIGWIAKRDRHADLSPAMREAIWLGFVLTFALTMIVAGYMSSGGGHFVGTHPVGAPTLPLLGWSGVTGDLRPAHFASLHVMQALPLLALWLDRRAGPRVALRRVRIAAALSVGVTLALFAQALLEMPLIPLG